MADIDKVLARIRGVKPSGENKWLGYCPGHNDTNRSLSISHDPSRDQIAMFCHAGCDIDNILDSAGLEWADIQPERRAGSRGWDEEYRYTDRDGKYLYSNFRRGSGESKKMWHGRRYGDRYEKGLGDTERTLYNLPKLADAIDKGEPVYYVEGEKDVLTMQRIGLTATTAGSVNSWKARYREYFEGADVVIIADNDSAGKKLASTVARDLRGVVNSVKVVVPSDRPKGDVTDYLEAGGTKEALLRMIEDAPLEGVGYLSHPEIRVPGDGDIPFRTIPSGKKDGDGFPTMKIEQSIDNMVLALEEDPELKGKIRFDVIANEPKYIGQLPWRKVGDTFGQWTDADDANARALTYRKYGLRGAAMYEDAFNIIMQRHQFNPVVDFLEGLDPWDGEDHISRLLPDYLGAADTPYTRAVQRLDLVQRIARIYNPGCAADHAMVLVGPQGCGKTTYVKHLAITQRWYGKLSAIEGKDAVENLREKMLAELDELLALKKAKEVEAVKSFITTTVDTYREPYGRRSIDHPRFCTFIGTTNDTSFLTDRTGNRRFLPVQCAVNTPTKDLWSADARDDFLKAYAQALHIFKAADCRPELVLPKEIREEAARVQSIYLEEDPRVGLIQKYLDQTGSDRACVIELWQKALDMPGQPKRSESNQLHAIMRNDIHGWVEAGTQRFSDYGRQRAYKRNEDRIPDNFIEDDGSVPF